MRNALFLCNAISKCVFLFVIHEGIECSNCIERVGQRTFDRPTDRLTGKYNVYSYKTNGIKMLFARVFFFSLFIFYFFLLHPFRLFWYYFDHNTTVIEHVKLRKIAWKDEKKRNNNKMCANESTQQMQAQCFNIKKNA